MNRPGWAEKAVSEALLKHATLATEVKAGYNNIALVTDQSDAWFQTEMLGHAERLIPLGYDVPVEMAEEKPQKLWVSEYRNFVRAIDLILSTKIGESVRNYKAAA